MFHSLAKSAARLGVAEALIFSLAGTGCLPALKTTPAADCSRYVRARAEAASVPAPKNARDFLSANVQGLPFGLDNLSRKTPYPPNRFECLGEIASAYDIAVFQEDWQDNQKLTGNHPYRLSAKPSDSLFRAGSGLTLLSREPFTEVRDIPFKNCSGGHEIVLYAWAKAVGFPAKWTERFNTKADCFATKGFRLTRTGNLMLVNSHLDAGNTSRDSRARASQLEQITEKLPKSIPLLIAFDANLKSNIPRDEDSLARFLRENDLKIALRNKTDLILYRGLTVKNVHTVDLTDLSDHNGLALTFMLPQSTAPPTPQVRPAP